MTIIEPKLSPTAIKISQKRYLRTDMSGKVIETPGEMLWRVARHMAKAEVNWNGGNGKVAEIAVAFYDRMVNFKFVCAGKAMFEAGNPGGTGQLSSCFVLPVEDNIQSIFKTLGDAAVVHKNNGGTGFNFSRIRPRGDKVKNVPNAASGPVDFLAAYSAALSKILQGAKRQGANIGILNADHPDIEDFIRLKDEDGTIKNFNISVGVTDEFMKAVQADKMWNLINPRTGEPVRKIKARKLFKMIVDHAHQTGDPGLMFLDTFNRDNPTPQIGRIEATNPCGEIGLLPYESCNLTSICLQNHIKEARSKKQETMNGVDWEDLEKSVRLGVRFLDDMIEVNTYAIPEIEQMVKNGNRRIGLGVMGFSHMLVKLGIPYNSSQAEELSEKLAKFIQETAQNESMKLAKVRGNFGNWDRSIYFDKHPMRNCATTMIAPTGTTAMLADTTSGIEPIFSLVTKRRTFFEDDRKNRPTKEIYMVDPVFEEELKRVISENSENSESRNVRKSENQKIRSSDFPILRLSDLSETPSFPSVLKHVAEYGLKSIEGLPGWFYKIFVTTHEISPSWHVKIQAAWQKHFDNSISKTINFPHNTTVEDVEKAYILAWKLGCKGITIYRDGSKKDQVLNLAKDTMTNDQLRMTNENSAIQHLPLRPGSGPAAVCPECGAAVIAENGCVTCHSCGWSKCSV
ncbi:adenosylcobalamin-dependent ribonucleoside-diphosphate reductase [Candidatus Collierbacteria bacterium]|nr:adenosylcobalamin-dependent ribonucleoside-diphosphate reductase [Candidatus Collierbacteria bacterium]